MCKDEINFISVHLTHCNIPAILWLQKKPFFKKISCITHSKSIYKTSPMHAFPPFKCRREKKHKYQWKVFLENFSQNLRENHCIICWQTKRTKRRNEAAKQRMMNKLQCNQPVKHSYHTQHDLICCQGDA